MDKMEIPKVTNVPFPFFFDFLNLVVDVKDGEDGGMSQWVTEDIFTAGGVTAFTARTISFCVDLWRRRVSRTVWEIRSCLRGSHPGFRGILPPPHLSQVCFCTLSLHRRDRLNSKGPQFFIFPKTRFISAKAASPSSPRLRVQKQEKKKVPDRSAWPWSQQRELAPPKVLVGLLGQSSWPWTRRPSLPTVTATPRRPEHIFLRWPLTLNRTHW